jgi:hypothetical protein
MSAATCKACPFWEPPKDGAGPSGYCHHARSYLVAGDTVRTFADGWCSEHPLLQRDRLAAMAMQGLVACEDALSSYAGPDGTRPYRVRVALLAYEIADAMLAARGEQP